MSREAAQGREDTDVVPIVGTELEAIALRYFERDFENVDRIEAETFAVKRREGIDRSGIEVQIQGRNQQFCKFLFGVSLLRRRILRRIGGAGVRWRVFCG